MTGDFFLTTWIFLGMRWLCENVLNNSVFWTILISTVVLRLATLPSDIAQRKSQAKNAEIQPLLADLQKKYKDDPRKYQIEQQKLMKEHGVSMTAGCLPLLITLPLLFCFIAAFRFWGYEQNVKMLVEMDRNMAVAAEAGLNPETESEVSETFLQSKFLWINNIWQADNGFKPVVMPADEFFKGAAYRDTKKLIYLQKENPDVYKKLVDMGLFYDEQEGYEDLSAERKEKALERAKATYTNLTGPLIKHYEGYNNGFFILPILATLFQFLYAWYVQKQQKAKTATAAANAPGANMTKYMMYLLPVMSFFFCLTYTSAFSIYWTLSSAVMLIINVALSLKLKESDA